MEQNRAKELFIYPNKKLNESYKNSSNDESSQMSNEITYPQKRRIIKQHPPSKTIIKDGSKYRYNISLNKKREYINNDIYSDNENSEQSDNNKIFTTITPNFNINKIGEKSKETNEDIDFENRTYCNYKRIPQNKNPIYKKFRTPDRKYTYYRKKKKRDSTDNTYSVSYCTESNNPINNSNIYDSLDEGHKNLNPEEYSRKINKLIKCGLKFELNNENNNYIDLLTLSDIKSLEDKINIQKLSKMKNSRKLKSNEPENNNIYVRKTYNQRPININTKDSKDSLVNYKSRNNISKIMNGDLSYKSYDCTTFKKKIGINKKRKIKQNKKTNSSDKYYTNAKRNKRKSRGTPIKKENDKGGKIDFRPKLFSKLNNDNSDQPYLLNLNKKYLYAVALIQNWWRKNHFNFINKIRLIQRAIRNFLNKNNKRIIYQKKTSLKTLYSKNNTNNKENNKEKENDGYNINNYDEGKVVLIQRKMREYLNNKKNQEKNLEDVVDYIPKDICEIDKTRKRQIIHKMEKQIDNRNKLSNKRPLIEKKNTNNIRTIKNTNINDINNNLCKSKIISLKNQENIDKHKLSVSPLNKITISPDKVRYDTDRYTFLKRCYFKNESKDKEQNKLNRLYTTEFMRKINLRIKGKYLTPDKINKKNINPSLQIDHLNEEGNVQFLSKDKHKNKFKETNDENLKNNYNIKVLENTDKNNKGEKKEPEEKKDNNILNKIDNLVQEANITEEVIKKCIMEEIVICNDKNKNKNSSNLEDNNIKDEEMEKFESYEEYMYGKKIDKIILIQRNLKIFLEKLKPKIKKFKKTVLSKKIEDKIPEKEKEEKDIYIKKKTIKKNEIIKNLYNVQNLEKDEKNNSETNEIHNDNSNEQNNINEPEKKEDNPERNSSIKESEGNEDINNANNNQSDNTTNNDININENKILDMKYINKIPTKSFNINTTKINNINNEENTEMQYIDKQPSKAININNNIINNTENNEMLYINKLPSKAININTNKHIELNNTNNMKYINKKPSKAFNINTNINKNLDNNGVEYIYKMTSKAFNINKIQKENKDSIEESINSSCVNVDNVRYSCPIKEVKQVTYKKYNKDYLENLLKDNVNNINQLKEIQKNNKYFKFDYILKMFLQRVQKINKQFVFQILKGEGFKKQKIYYFNVIKTYLKNKNLYINDNNDVSNLLKETLESYSSIYDECEGKFIPYIKLSDEEKLINTQLFRHDENCNNLVTFICKYLKLEKNLTNFSDDLIKYHLMKKPLKNFNIFGLTRYIESLYLVILYSKNSKLEIKDGKNKENLNLDYIHINDEDDKENESFYENNIEFNNQDNDIKNVKYVRKTINYKKANRISMKRHIKNLSSCDINNNSNENIPDVNVNNSLIKKNVEK